MKFTFKYALIAGSLSLHSLSIEAAGFRVLEVNDPGHPVLEVGLWYPSDQPEADKPNTPFNLPVALDAPIDSANGSLIVMSHGFGGWLGGHADTAAALADAGFVVAAPTHNGNTYSDMSSTVEKWMLDRPRHISRVIDHVLDNDEFDAHVDPSMIGVYGFSAGGYTALGLIGGTPDFERATSHCAATPEEFVCAEGMLDAVLDADMESLPRTAWGADPRVKAAVISAVISAPGFGFAYSADTLSEVTADIQLWSGELDDSVPTESNAAWLAGQLPARPETYWIDNANHFAFMVTACREAFKQADPEEYELVCSDAEGFDRREFSVLMQDEMIRFFNESFSK